VELHCWWQLETLTLVLTNAPTTNHKFPAQLHAVFENERAFYVPIDVFSIHQWYFLPPIVDDIPSLIILLEIY
jgi:hypothetical protein